MGTYPTTPRSAFAEWCTVHVPIFTANAAAIGLTPAQATAFSAAVEAAVAAEEESANARQSARTATQNASMKFADLRRSAGATVGLIKAFANLTDNPNVYNLAEIPAPTPSSPLPPPGQPNFITVGLEPTTGAIELRWKCVNPAGSAGTAYIVRRRSGTVTPSTPFEFVGVTGEKRFVDATFSAGPDRVEYTVQAQRADATGPVSAIVVVNFGLPGLGMGGTAGNASLTYSTIENTPGPAERSAGKGKTARIAA